MEKKNSSSITDIVITYGVTIISIIAAFTLAAYSVAGAIAMFADEVISLPSIFGVFGGNSAMSLITTSALGVLFAVVAHLGMGKVSSSKDAAALVASDNYQMINKIAKAFCFITAALAGVAAIAVLLATILTISDYTPWKSRFVGTIIPLLFIGAGLAGAGIVINKFIKAAIKPNVLAMIALGMAIFGIILACIAVLVDAHVSKTPTSTIRSVYESILD